MDTSWFTNSTRYAGRAGRAQQELDLKKQEIANNAEYNQGRLDISGREVNNNSAYNMGMLGARNREIDMGRPQGAMASATSTPAQSYLPFDAPNPLNSSAIAAGNAGMASAGTRAPLGSTGTDTEAFAEGGLVESESEEPPESYTLDPDVVHLLGEDFLERITDFVRTVKAQLQQTGQPGAM